VFIGALPPRTERRRIDESCLGAREYPECRAVDDVVRRLNFCVWKKLPKGTGPKDADWPEYAKSIKDWTGVMTVRLAARA